MTLTFQGVRDPQVVTVELSTNYLLQRPLPAQPVIDMIISEGPVNDATPEISIQTNGRSAAVATRMASRRSISTFMTVEEVGRLAHAESIIAHAFGAELHFSALQSSRLRAAATQWAARLQ